VFLINKTFCVSGEGFLRGFSKNPENLKIDPNISAFQEVVRAGVVDSEVFPAEIGVLSPDAIQAGEPVHQSLQRAAATARDACHSAVAVSFHAGLSTFGHRFRSWISFRLVAMQPCVLK